MRPTQPLLGVILIVGSVFLMSLGDGLIKLYSANLTAWQMFVLRSLIALPILVTLLRMLAPGRELRPRSIGWVGLRSALLTLMWIAYYAALPLISLSAAAVAFYTAPLFIALLSRPLAGEPVGPIRWLGIALGFAGVLVALRPGGDTFSLAALLPVLAALLYALASLITRVRCAHEHPVVLAIGLNLGLLCAGLVVSCGLWLQPLSAEHAQAHPFLFGPWAAMDLATWMLVGLLALLMVAYASGVAMAYQIAPAALIGAFDYSYVVFAVLWSFLLFGERPDAGTVAGIALILAAGILVASRSGRATSATPRTRLEPVE